MLLSLAELRESGEIGDYTLRLPVETIEFQGDTFSVIESPEVHLRLNADGEEGVTVTGWVKAKFKAPCARCLGSTELSINAQISDTWNLSLQETTEDDFFNSSFISENGETVDLEEYALELLLEQLPLRVICRDDCKGLCSNCGENLNEAECGCERKDIDPRLAVLGRLLGNKGGVRDGGS